MFDPRNPYHRRRWHYDSDQPLSIAQLIAAKSLDAYTAALMWVLIERHQSVIVSGPTDPTPGVGKTTTLNALLEFLPVGTTVVYTMGMYEDFDFLAETDSATTCVLANEVSNHLPIYMWGRVARQLLTLPGQGYAIASSCHADTIQDVMRMLRRELRLDAADVGRLGLVVNIGLVGRIWPPRRRFLTVNFIRPAAAASDSDGSSTDREPTSPNTSASRANRVELLEVAAWDEATDTFRRPSQDILAGLAESVGLAPAEMERLIEQRARCLDELALGQGANIRATRMALEAMMQSDAPTIGDDDEVSGSAESD